MGVGVDRRKNGDGERGRVPEFLLRRLVTIHI